MTEKRPNHRPYKKMIVSKELTDRYYTIYESADILKVHHNTIRRAIKSGRLKATKFGREWRIRKENIIDIGGTANGNINYNK